MTKASSIILAPPGAIYSAISAARVALYRRGLLKVSRLDAPVISVGNITAGGTGKTPLVEYLARSLANEGHKVCILTRGYGRRNAHARALVSDGEHILANEPEAGDEPLLLAQNLKGIAAVISDADRFAAGQWAIRELRSDVFILDDGFQHLQLARDLNLVTIDATAPWGEGQLLRLRERRSGLARADCIVITRADQTGELTPLIRDVTTASRNRPLFTSRMKVRSIRSLHESPGATNKQPGLKSPVAAFCAIGNPASFSTLIARAGYDPVSVSVFPDHHRYDQGDIARIVEEAKTAGVMSLVTTAKDAVKLAHLSFELPCYVVEVQISIEDEPRFAGLVHAAITRK